MGEGGERKVVAPATREKDYLIYANLWSRVPDNSVERLSIFLELSFQLVKRPSRLKRLNIRGGVCWWYYYNEIINDIFNSTN